MADFTPKFYDDNGNSFTPDLEFTEDGFEKDIVEYEYPFVSGADLDDMGGKARVITVKAYFIGENYSAHASFLDWLKQSNSKRHFIHPKYGLLTGDIKKVFVRHDDQKDAVSLDITFIENAARTAVPASKVAVVDATTDAAIAGSENRRAWLAEQLNAAQKTYSSVKQQVTAFQNKIIAATATFEATLSAVSNPATSFTSLLNWASSVPADMVLACAQAVERYAVAYETLKSTPAAFVSKLSAAFTALEDSFADFNSGSAAATAAGAAVQVLLTLSCAEALAMATADVFSQEQDIRDSLSASSATSSVDSNGNFVPRLESTDDSDSTVVSALMTEVDLEATLALARAYLQKAITAARAAGLDSQTYKDMALALETHVNTIKLQREMVKTVDLDQPMPLHLICLRYGLPYNAAERLLSMNPTLSNPNQASGEVNIYDDTNV